jgi:hypothetical protein
MRVCVDRQIVGEVISGWTGIPVGKMVKDELAMVLDLESSAEAQWKAFDSKLRNQIRKGEKSGFQRTWGAAGLGDFHRVMLENMRDLGTPLRGERYYRQVLANLGEAADILVVGDAGDPAATMFTVEHRDTFTDPWASSLRRHVARCPNQVLYWEAIQRALARGRTHFDMGRSQRNSGTFLFKQQWGAQPVQLHYQYILGTAAEMPTLAGQKGSLDIAVQLWRKLPLPIAGLLGEPAKRLFPEVM